jgi:hypothetical protein
MLSLSIGCPPSPPAPIKINNLLYLVLPLLVRRPHRHVRPPRNWWEVNPVAGPPPPPVADEQEDEEEAEKQAQYSSPSDPVNITVVLKRDDGQRWMEAAFEMNGHIENTWEIVGAPPGANICKWVLNTKYNDGSMDCYKATIAAKGFNIQDMTTPMFFAPTMHPASLLSVQPMIFLLTSPWHSPMGIPS